MINFLKDLKVFWKTLVIIITPIVFLPLVFAIEGKDKYLLNVFKPVFKTKTKKILQEAKCGYVVVVMAIYWITEALPLSITAFVPVVLFPMLGVMKGTAIAQFYIQDTTLTFLAGLMMALAIENVNLHKRIGTGILVNIGATPSRILIGFMFPAWFLSMWISNTATTSMMIPAVEAVTTQMRLGMKRSKLSRNRNLEKSESADDMSIAEPPGIRNMAYEGADCDPEHRIRNEVNEDENKDDIPAENVINKTISNCIDTNGDVCALTVEVSQTSKTADDKRRMIDEIESVQLDKEEENKIRNISRMLSLAVAYSSNIGGTATLTGTPTNLLISDAAMKLDPNTPLNYASWLFFGLPHSIICGFLLWIWLQLYFLGWRSFTCKKDEDFASQEKALKIIMKNEYKKLGKLTFGEASCGLLLIVMVILWLTRDPGFIPGYASLFEKGFVTDSTPAMLIAIILFAYPSEVPRWLCLRDRSEKAKIVPALLNWNLVSTKMPWGPILLLGGGFVLAEGCKVSGLSNLIADRLVVLENLDKWIIALIITVMISFITEIMSNTAVISLFIPILTGLATKIEINPLYLLIPSGMAASYAFMLPIATPPNAIVFSFGHLKVVNMAKVGFMMNCLCILVVTLGINTWGYPIFKLNEMPVNISMPTS